VYSAPDKESLAVRLADLAVAVGETNAYLSIEKMIEAAIRTGCDAIHPG
jgi:acetyl/propionyl-CoA carboxylase alpha subunit